ncbi:PIN domain-containing protein [Deinococcus multiflagellatus]|uniref:PIN domain-containing protein n=1 Tax=Deinococcus multiflagellatus TaxID=1656887 RepID=A0ABW1ZR66_9DEIO|nr:PIN domain-containing protein [Deinococcus multiflagellatus]MBZ9715822.1 PIN domain-containing protein [Deinococcus multiflagellatus]
MAADRPALAPSELTAPVSAQRHPRTLPALNGTLNLTGRTVVLLLDANVIMRDLHAAVTRGPEDPPSALFELLGAPHGRLVMSAGDVALVGGVTRLERNIYDKFPAHAEAMVALWAAEVQPRLLFLDPAGLPDTPLSAEVRRPERDPDDADLALLGWVLDADGLLTYDKKAFGGLITTLEGKGTRGHGMYLCAFRDDLRVEQVVAWMVGVPITALATAALSMSESLKKYGITSRMQGVLALGLAGVLALWPQGRAAAGRAAMAYGTFAFNLMPTLEVTQQIQDARARVRPEWPATEDPVVRCARLLVRRRGTLTCTELRQHLGLRLTAGELFARLQAQPGLFDLHPGRRWSIRGTRSPEQQALPTPSP